jgi:hypothetical protein
VLPRVGAKMPLPGLGGAAAERYGLKGLTPIEGQPNTYWSCCWELNDSEAEDLVGGWLYLHQAKRQPSHFGGRILGFERLWNEGEAVRKDRVRLQIEARPEGIGRQWRGQHHRMAYTSRPVAPDFPHERAG